MGSESLNFETEALRVELRELGASMPQRQLFESNVDRARAAIAQAYDRGAGNPLSYAISLFRSETFMPDPKRKAPTSNVHGKVDPTRTDDGERIWQADEVDETWRRGYLADCIDALEQGRDPAARYAPSDAEFAALTAVAQTQTLDQVTLRNAARALAGWATVWDFDDLGRRLERSFDVEPGLEDEPSLDEEPVLS